MSLEGKRVYITGGTGGIGLPLVARLQNDGATVQLYNQRTEGSLSESLERVCQQLGEDTPDILINMAGYNVFDYCEKQDLEAIHQLNLMVPMRLCQAVLPAMRARNSGHIVNIGSMTGLIPLPHLTGYASAKAGLKAFTDALRRELGGSGISVTHVVPRAVRTSMNSGSKAEINERTGVNYDSAEKVAGIIHRAILQQKREVRIGWPERLFALLNALFPAVIDQGLQKNRILGEEVLAKPAKPTASAAADTPFLSGEKP